MKWLLSNLLNFAGVSTWQCFEWTACEDRWWSKEEQWRVTFWRGGGRGVEAEFAPWAGQQIPQAPSQFYQGRRKDTPNIQVMKIPVVIVWHVMQGFKISVFREDVWLLNWNLNVSPVKKMIAIFTRNLTGNTFKSQFNNHTSSFKNWNKMNSMELSKLIWDLKDTDTQFTHSWGTIAHTTASAYSSATKYCNLYINKKFFIICKPNLYTLNKINELASLHLLPFKQFFVKKCVNSKSLWDLICSHSAYYAQVWWERTERCSLETVL